MANFRLVSSWMVIVVLGMMTAVGGQDAEVTSTPEPMYPDGVNTIPGDAEVNYPIYEKIFKTEFSCSGRLAGFYADVEARCQIWHICDVDGRMQSFLCTNGTIFSQATRVCEWWYNTNCDIQTVTRNYEHNKDLYKTFKDLEDDDDTIENSGEVATVKPKPTAHSQVTVEINYPKRTSEFEPFPTQYTAPVSNRPDPTRGLPVSEFYRPEPTRSLQAAEFNRPEHSRNVQKSEVNRPAPEPPRQRQLSDSTRSGPPRNTKVYDFDLPDSARNIQQSEFNRPEPTRSIQAVEFNRPDLSRNVQVSNPDRPESPRNPKVYDFDRPESPGNTKVYDFDRPEPPPRNTKVYDFDRPESPRNTKAYDFDQPEPPRNTKVYDFDRPEPTRNTKVYDFDRPEPPRKIQVSEFNRPDPIRNIQVANSNRHEPPRNLPASDPSKIRPFPEVERSTPTRSTIPISPVPSTRQPAPPTPDPSRQLSRQELEQRRQAARDEFYSIPAKMEQEKRIHQQRVQEQRRLEQQRPTIPSEVDAPFGFTSFPSLSPSELKSVGTKAPKPKSPPRVTTLPTLSPPELRPVGTKAPKPKPPIRVTTLPSISPSERKPVRPTSTTESHFGFTLFPAFSPSERKALETTALKQESETASQHKFRHSTPREHNVNFRPSSRTESDERQVPAESKANPFPPFAAAGFFNRNGVPDVEEPGGITTQMNSYLPTSNASIEVRPTVADIQRLPKVIATVRPTTVPKLRKRKRRPLKPQGTPKPVRNTVPLPVLSYRPPPLETVPTEPEPTKKSPRVVVKRKLRKGEERRQNLNEFPGNPHLEHTVRNQFNQQHEPMKRCAVSAGAGNVFKILC